jgi:hypothetical protein
MVGTLLHEKRILHNTTYVPIYVNIREKVTFETFFNYCHLKRRNA